MRQWYVVLCGGRQDGEVLTWRGVERPPSVEVPAGDEVLTYYATETRDYHRRWRYVLNA